MRKKYLIISITLLLMSSVISGCGNGNKKNENVENMQSTEDVVTQEDFAAKEEILSCKTFDNKLQFGIEAIEVPCKFQTILDQGATITNDKYSPEYLVDPETTVDISMNLYGMDISVQIRNPGQSILKAFQCQVEGILGVNSKLITFPGGIQAGVSTYDEVSSIWGDGNELTTAQDTSDYENGDTFTYFYYRDGVSYKDVYAFESNGNTGSSSDIIDVGGYKYEVTFNRSSGVIVNIDAYFTKKSGLDTWQQMTYVCGGGKVIFEVLEDAYITGDKNNILFCTEKINEIPYIIGVGMVASKFDAAGTLLEEDKVSVNYGWENVNSTETEAEDKKKIPNPANSLGKSLLRFGNYDFSNNYFEIGGTRTWRSYAGESETESIYFSISAEMRMKGACSVVFYLHPLNASDRIQQEAIDYMHNYEKHVRDTISFE